jgi:hypothetical protein
MYNFNLLFTIYVDSSTRKRVGYSLLLNCLVKAVIRVERVDITSSVFYFSLEKRERETNSINLITNKRLHKKVK